MSVEKEVKEQFARVFYPKDWRLFKKMAESNLREAAKLQKADMLVEAPLRLLARNSRKRLLIGIGVELLLKAAYLKQGYMINKPVGVAALTFPFTRIDSQAVNLAADSTYGLNEQTLSRGGVGRFSYWKIRANNASRMAYANS